MKKYYGSLIGGAICSIFCIIRTIQLYNYFFIEKDYTYEEVLFACILMVLVASAIGFIIGAITDIFVKRRDRRRKINRNNMRPL